MEVLKDFPEDFAKALQTSFFILRIFNIRYLEDERSFVQKNWRFSYIGVTVIIHVVTLGLCLPELVTGDEMSQFAYLIPSILMTIHVSFWISVFGTGQYILSPLAETLVRIFILKQDSKLILPFDSTYPFNPTKNWVIYILVYTFQLYSISLLVTVYSGAALIMITSCGLLTIEFMMLKNDLARVKPRLKRKHHVAINNGDDGPTIEQFVERHQKLLRLSRQLDSAFNGMVFIDLLFVGITTCGFTFMGQFSHSPTYRLLSYVGVASSMLTVLYLCYYGELLTSASSSIGDTAYQNLWYKGEKQYKMTIWLIIKIAQKPCRLTSLRYADVSLNMFTKVVSTTWSYFSLMNSVYSDEE